MTDPRRVTRHEEPRIRQHAWWANDDTWLCHHINGRGNWVHNPNDDRCRYCGDPRPPRSIVQPRPLPPPAPAVSSGDALFSLYDSDIGGLRLDVYVTERRDKHGTIRFVGNGTEFTLVDVPNTLIVKLGNGLLDAVGSDAAIPKGSHAAELLSQCLTLANRHDPDLATSIRLALGGIA